jgi:hypothetical protein
MTFNIYTIEKSRGHVRGNINWKRTLFSSRSSSHYPLNFISKSNQYDYSTSENLILLLSIKKLQGDAFYIKNGTFLEKLSSKELDLLNIIIRNCSIAIKEPLFKDIFHLIAKISLIELNNEIVTVLEQDFKNRLINKDISNSNYNKLFVWFRKYHNYNLRNITPKLNNYIITKRESLDSMFELYILLEIINLKQQ